MRTIAVSKATPKPENKPTVPENELKVRIQKVFDDPSSKLRAYASISLNGSFAVHGIRIVEGEKGLFVAMPSTKYGEKYSDTFHAITSEAHKQLNDTVLAAYEEKLSQLQAETQEEPDEAPIEQSM